MRCKLFCVLVLLLILGYPAFNQSHNEDMGLYMGENNFLLLQKKSAPESHLLGAQETIFMKSRSGKFLVRYNPVRLFFGAMMFIYQGYVSPQLPSECLYAETCSHYSQSLILRYGIFKGVLATSDRLMRCNRFSSLDIHPISVDTSSGKVVESVEIYDFSNSD